MGNENKTNKKHRRFQDTKNGGFRKRISVNAAFIFCFKALFVAAITYS